MECRFPGRNISRSAKSDNGLFKGYYTVGNRNRPIMTSKRRRRIGNRYRSRRSGLLCRRCTYRSRKGGIVRCSGKDIGCIGIGKDKTLRLHVIGTGTVGKIIEIDALGLDIPSSRNFYVTEVFIPGSPYLGVHFNLRRPTVERIGQCLPIGCKHIQGRHTHPRTIDVLVEVTVSRVTEAQQFRIFSFKRQYAGLPADIILDRRDRRKLPLSSIIEYIALGM